MDPARQAATVLAQLGNSADQVAHSLKTRGIQGVRHTVRFLNPVVRYLKAELAESTSMDVIKRDQLSIALPDGRKLDVPLPPAVRAFLDAFDQRTYPELELPLDSL
jgi:hypothetical protein